MLAVITALASLPARSSVTVITDSEYVKRGITEWIHTWEKSGWKTSEGKPVKNLDLWLLMKNVVKAHHVEFKWTPGHSGVWGNESADFIAKLMAKNLKKQAELAIARAKLYQDVKKYVASR